MVEQNMTGQNIPHGYCQCGCGQLAPIAKKTKHSIGHIKGQPTKRIWGHGAVTHGGRQTPEFIAWCSMKRRTSTSAKNTKWYSERGIVVCAGWRNDFLLFRADVGARPTPEHSIDRKDNDGNYSCGKCEQCVAEGWPMNARWATPTQQSRNQRSNRMITFQGETLCAAEWAQRLSIKGGRLIYRLNNWSLDRVLASMTNAQQELAAK